MLYTIVGIVFITLGFAIGWYGLRPLAVVPKVLRANVQDPGEVTEAGSYVVCRGIANESSETISAPFTGSPCLGFEFEITERQPFGIGIPWFQAHLDDGMAARPFTLDGPHGELSILPSTKRFSLDTESTIITTTAKESTPDQIQRFVDVRDEIKPVSRWIQLIPGLGTRHYIERRIDIGEEYFIAGKTEGQQNEVVLEGNLVITDRTPSKFAIKRFRKAVFPTIVAATFVAVGIGGIML